MPIPVIPIIAAITPLVLGAFELYRRRSAAHEVRAPKNEENDMARLAHSLQKRMTELEESDIEQAKLISELAKNVEALAKALQSEIDEKKEREIRIYRVLIGLLVLGGSSLGLTLWHIFQ
jgi:biopolymer transport protein ExbB/TolQ